MKVRIAIATLFFMGVLLAPSIFLNEKVEARRQSQNRCTVMTNTDTIGGIPSLRYCLTQLISGTVIVFDTEKFPLTHPTTIMLTEAFPPITVSHVTIDASDAGVILNGGNLINPFDLFNGLVIDDANNITIKGLQITGFSGNGLVIQNGAHNVIGGGDISADSSCSGSCNSSQGNGQNGIEIRGIKSYSNTISGNYIFNNGDNGLNLISGTTRNFISHNRIVKNGNNGVKVSGFNTKFNTISQNSIYNNARKNINLALDSNNKIAPPVLLTVTVSPQSDLVTLEGIAEPNSTLEFFFDGNKAGIYADSKFVSDDTGYFSAGGRWDSSNLPIIATATDPDGNTSEYSILPGSSSGTFYETYQLTLKSMKMNTHAVTLGDFNDDGHLDVFVANSGSNKVLFNDGTANLLDNLSSPFSEVLATSDVPSKAAVVGDVDKDGDLDTVVANEHGVEIWLNSGTGTFSTTQQISGTTEAVALGDINGDDNLDLVAGQTGLSQIWLNSGTGVFTNSGQTLPMTDTQAVLLEDVNEDGNLDIVANNGGVNQVWLNSGTGVFSNTDQTIGNDSQAVAIGDVNNDGHVDIVIGNHGPSEIWLNSGSGVFTNSGQSLGDSDTQAVALGDVNTDGNIDIVFGNNGPNQIWLNGGSGVFSDTLQSIGDTNTTAVALGDLDGDGDVDIYWGNGGEDSTNQVFLNINAQSVGVNAQTQLYEFTQCLPFTIAAPDAVTAKVITFTYIPLPYPPHAFSSKLGFGGRAFKLEAIRNEQAITDPFNGQPMTLTLSYNQVKLDENKLVLYYWNTASAQWLDVATTCNPPSTYRRSPDQLSLQVPICHLSEFSLFGEVRNEVFLPIILKK